MVILTHEKLKHLCESISLNNNTLKQKDLHYPNGILAEMSADLGINFSHSLNYSYAICKLNEA